MNVDPSLDPKSHQKHTRMGVIRWLIREYLGTLFVGVILFWTAGTINWLMAWLLVGIYAAWVTASALLIIPKNPELLVERASRKKSSETWDNIIMAVFGVTTIVKFFLAGLDYRYSWTSQISEQIQILTVFVTVLGFYLVTWAMTVNAYFSMTNRIQNERGHSVATGGPYRIVRHPGYVGTILTELSVPIMLGSLWALIPGVISVVLLVIRTRLEDKMLQEKLSGYVAYTRKTKYRLIPGVW